MPEFNMKQTEINTQEAIDALNEDYPTADQTTAITQNGEINIAADKVELNISNPSQSLELENEYLRRENTELKEQIKTLTNLINLLKK